MTKPEKGSSRLKQISIDLEAPKTIMALFDGALDKWFSEQEVVKATGITPGVVQQWLSIHAKDGKIEIKGFLRATRYKKAEKPEKSKKSNRSKKS